MEEEIKEEQPKSNKKLGIIIIVISVLLIGTGCTLFFMTDTTSTSNSNKESNNNKETNVDNTEKDDSNIIVDVELNEQVMNTYEKYHSSSNPVQLSGNAVETDIYNGEVFNVSSLSSDLPNNYAKKIIDAVVNDMNTNNLVDDNYQTKVYENIEREFKAFFGSNVEYNKDLFKCFEFSNNNNTIEYISNCGDTSPTEATYEVARAEKDNNNLYIYEAVKIVNSISQEQEEYRYKWTYNLQEDGNYYFLKAERIA